MGVAQFIKALAAGIKIRRVRLSCTESMRIVRTTGCLPPQSVQNCRMECQETPEPTQLIKESI